MSIATQISALQQDKTDIATAITNKGGTVSSGDGFDDFAADIATIPSGGGDLLYVEPLPLQTISQNDKVFMQPSEPEPVQVYSTSVTASTTDGNTYAEPYFIDNDNIVCLAPSTTYSLKYSYVSGTGWQSSSLTQTVDAMYNVTFQTASRGNFLVVAGVHYLDNGDGTFTDLSDGNYYYAGKFFNQDYCVRKNNGAIYLYDWTNKQVGSLYYSRTISYLSHGVDEASNRLYIQAKNMNIYIIEFTSSAASQKKYTGLDGYIVGYTGLDEGDYIFAISPADNYFDSQNVSTTDGTTGIAGNPSYSGDLYIYRVASDASVAEIDNTDILYQFHIQQYNTAHYDMRNHILSIGTTTGVYFYEFDTTTKTFTALNITGFSLPSPTITNGSYSAAMSPDKQNIVIYNGNPYYQGRNLKIYTMSSGGWEQVDVTQSGVDFTDVYTGIATGNTQGGKYEVETVLKE